MGMSNAERQRKFRENRDRNPEKREAYLQRERNRNMKKKEKGILKSVQDMTAREKRAARKRWRNQKRKKREQIKEQAKVMKSLLTPPNTPAGVNGLPEDVVVQQKKQSSKKKKREIAKCYRDNERLKKELAKQKLVSDKYRKRLERQSEMQKRQESKLDTPRTKTRKLLRHFPQKIVRKTLVFQTALIEQIKQKYRNKLKKGQKKDILDILHGSVLRKYKIKTAAMRILGINLRNKRVTERKSLSRTMYSRVREFYERDDVSRMTSGIRNTVTVNKQRRQRRVLNDTLRNLHVKFLSETSEKLSYTTFCRLRPFWVKHPTDRDRDTCLCRLCDNTYMMASALRQANILKTDDLEDICIETVCSAEKKECMFKTCTECNELRIHFDRSNETEDIQWEEWRTKTEKRMISTGKELQEKDVTFTIKETLNSTVNDLCDKFEDQVDRYKKHLFTYRWQYNYLRTRKEHLKESECIVHVDFSENYEGKMSKQVQGMNFGASKRQISLHTGVLYLAEGKQQTFCTVSDNIHHGPAAIWAHLSPVLTDIRKKYQQIKSVEFFNDGPSSQYRQKYNFYLLVSEPYNLGFQNVEWNFFEAGHGKGVPDAVGGSIKRKADQKVKYGQTIMSANMFVKHLKDSKTILIEIKEDKIEKARNELRNTNPKAIPGTLRLHQIKSCIPGSLFYRDISCVCTKPKECQGHELKSHKFPDIYVERPLNQNNQSNANESGRGKKETKCSSSKTSSTDSDKGNKNTSEEQNKEATGKSHHEFYEELRKCKGLRQLRNKCQEITDSFGELDNIPQSVTFLSGQFEVDTIAIEDYPDDVPYCKALYPSKVPADGNCLPSCGSVFGYGFPNFSNEVRLRILCELVLHENKYLNNEFLLAGLSDTVRDRNLVRAYAQYSDMWVPGMRLNEDTIKSIYRMELHKIKINHSFMGIWQIHALSSVLKIPIFSVYPKKGVPSVCQHLNRLVMPRLGKQISIPRYILWTSTRTDEMVHEYWNPNHFVPCLPTEEYVSDSKSISSEVSFLAEGLQNKNRSTSKAKCSMSKKKWRKFRKGLSNPGMVYTESETQSETGIRNIQMEHSELSSQSGTGGGIIEKEQTKSGSQSGTGASKTEMKHTESGCQSGSGVNSREIEDTRSGNKQGTGKSNIEKEHVQPASQLETSVSSTGIEMEHSELEAQSKINRSNIEVEHTESGSQSGVGVSEHVEPGSQSGAGVSNTEMEHMASKSQSGTGVSNIEVEHMESESQSEAGVSNIDMLHIAMEHMESGSQSGAGVSNIEMEHMESRSQSETDVSNIKMDHMESESQSGAGVSSIEIKHMESESQLEADVSNIEMMHIAMEHMESGNQSGAGVSNTGMESGSWSRAGVSLIETEQMELGSQSGVGVNYIAMEHMESGSQSGAGVSDTDMEHMESGSQSEAGISTTETEHMESGNTKSGSQSGTGISNEVIGTAESGSKSGTSLSNLEMEQKDSYNEREKEAVDWKSIPHPTNCVGKYVIVKYGKHAYPGIVEDAGENDVYVQCMHGVGRKQCNIFYWPKKIIDRCWYDFEDILAVIPVPTRIPGSYSHFKVNDSIWNSVTEEVAKK